MAAGYGCNQTRQDMRRGGGAERGYSHYPTPPTATFLKQLIERARHVRLPLRVIGQDASFGG
jgi:hypothetical protein